jgi:hypothetical protein
MSHSRLPVLLANSDSGHGNRADIALPTRWVVRGWISVAMIPTSDRTVARVTGLLREGSN